MRGGISLSVPSSLAAACSWRSRRAVGYSSTVDMASSSAGWPRGRSKVHGIILPLIVVPGFLLFSPAGVSSHCLRVCVPACLVACLLALQQLPCLASFSRIRRSGKPSIGDSERPADGDWTKPKQGNFGSIAIHPMRLSISFLKLCSFCRRERSTDHVTESSGENPHRNRLLRGP